VRGAVRGAVRDAVRGAVRGEKKYLFFTGMLLNVNITVRGQQM